MTPLTTKAAEIRAGLGGADELDATETMSPQDTARDLVDRFRSGDCPFCGHDPYHYVDNGVGMERVAVTCCDLGIALFQDGDEQLSRASGERHEAANALSDLLGLIESRAAELAGAERARVQLCADHNNSLAALVAAEDRATTAESERDELLREKERLLSAWGGFQPWAHVAFLWVGEPPRDGEVSRYREAYWQMVNAANAAPQIKPAPSSQSERIAVLEAAGRKALRFIEYTESEYDITFDSGDALRAALAPLGEE